MPRTPDAPEIPPAACSFTCDWGDCDEKTTAWRWSGQRLNESPLGWLPVCVIHASAADAVVAHNDGWDDACRCGHVRSSHQQSVARCTICECTQFDA